MIFAIATKCSVYLYDTQQKLPFGLISNIHYTRLTDLAWTNDGKTLLVSSTDGYCSIVQFGDTELGQVYKAQTLDEILASKSFKDDQPTKKKKKNKKNGSKKEEEKSPSIDEKENEDNKMEIDEPHKAEISIIDLPESIKEKISVDKIIKSSELFSPEKQIGSPATPIQFRKFPRNLEDIDGSPMKSESSKVIESKAPKAGSSAFSSVTPTRIEVRRQPRVLQPQPGSKDNLDPVEKLVLPADRKSKKKLLWIFFLF